MQALTYIQIYTYKHSFCHTHTLTYSQVQTRFKSVCSYVFVCVKVCSHESVMCMHACANARAQNTHPHLYNAQILLNNHIY